MFAASKTASVSGGYQISRSLRFNPTDSTNLNRTFTSAGNRQTWTYSSWVKRSGLSTTDEGCIFSAGATDGAVIRFETANTLRLYDYSGGFSFNLITTQVFRDASAWYHIVLTYDSTQATSSNRTKLYVNGSQVTSFSTATYPTLNQNTYNFNNNVSHRIGNHAWDFIKFYDGYMTEVNFIDGQALTPSSFGETNAQTGVWQPKAYSGSYGTNGFYLNFSDNSNTTAATLGKDYSGNGNNFTPNNFSVTAGAGNDSLVDSPTSYGTDTGVGGTVRGNYATLNGIFVPTTASVTNPTLANGNLSFVGNLSTDTSGRSTIGVTSGKWYCEVTVSYVSALQDGLGIAYTQSDSSRVYGVLYRASGDKCVNNTVTSYGTNYVAGSVIGIALDADANTVTFYNTNVLQGSISFTPTTAIYFSTYGTNASPAFAGDINFGQRPFAYTAPSGFKALNTQNLPTPTIGATTATQAGKYFNTVLWSGDDTNPRTITGVGFQPDWVWVKGRNAAVNHFLQDAVRGVTSSDTRSLVSNSTDAETNYYAGNGGVTAFASDGFTTSGGSANANLNLSGRTFVAWNWKANGSGSSNTSGSITSTVSANTTSGFSVVTYTGTGSAATVGHGLGVAPSMIIVKSRTVAGTGWPVYVKTLGKDSYLLLNSTNAAGSFASYWGSSEPTSSVFGVVNGPYDNNTGNLVAYCFAEVSGYSKFGSFVGNGSADGVFVYTGFRPAFVLIKQSSGGGGHWSLKDSVRSPSNVALANLFPNLSNAETSEYDYDILSNGFKLRTTSITVNASGETYIYACFAQNPFKTSLAR